MKKMTEMTIEEIRNEVMDIDPKAIISASPVEGMATVTSDMSPEIAGFF